MHIISCIGDSDFSAMHFRQEVEKGNIDLQDWAQKLSKKPFTHYLEFSYDNGQHTDSCTLESKKFGDVDLDFIEFIREEIQDPDQAKSSDFFVVE